MTHTAEDFERFFIRYKAEGAPSGVSLQKYCTDNKVPYNLFLKWYKDTRHKVVPIEVTDLPSESTSGGVEAGESAFVKDASVSSTKEVKIMIDVRMTNGLHLSRRGMSYRELQELVANLEVLC